MFCLQASYIERCYTEKLPFKGMHKDRVLALELYRLLKRFSVWPNEGQLKVMTMAYEDLFRGRSEQGKMCCRHRVPTFKFHRSLDLRATRVIDGNADTARSHPEQVKPEDILPEQVPGRLAGRAIAIHSFVTTNKGKFIN